MQYLNHICNGIQMFLLKCEKTQACVLMVIKMVHCMPRRAVRKINEAYEWLETITSKSAFVWFVNFFFKIFPVLHGQTVSVLLWNKTSGWMLKIYVFIHVNYVNLNKQDKLLTSRKYIYIYNALNNSIFLFQNFCSDYFSFHLTRGNWG